MRANPFRQHLSGDRQRSHRRPRVGAGAAADGHLRAVRNLPDRRGSAMLRRLSRRGWFRFTAIAGMAGLAAAVAGCSVSHIGLGDTADATVDVPAEKAPPVIDTGPDLACG